MFPQRVCAIVLSASLWACSGSTGCGAQGFTTLPQGTYQGEKLESAGAVRLSSKGFGVLNADSARLLELFAPGNQLTVPVPCSIQPVSVLGIPALQLATADTGTAGCTNEACGRLDGRCEASGPTADVGHSLTVMFSDLQFAPKSPDLVEARVTATVQTGLLPIAEVRSSLLCLFNGRAKCTVDLDTARSAPPTNDLTLNLRLVIDPRWDRLVTLDLVDLGGAKACSGGATAPACLDPADIVIANEGGCGACSTVNFAVVKTLLVEQLAKSLQKQLDKALGRANCASCDQTGACPTASGATSSCDFDAGVCLDPATGKCAPTQLAIEGRLEVGAALASFGAPASAALDLAVSVGGAVAAGPAGLTVGLRGGASERVVASCVRPLTRPLPPVLPLPDFDLYAPGPYDVGLGLSGQVLTEVLFRAQQSGALCLELGHETVTALESAALATVLPSLLALTEGQNVPLRLVVRPVNPPSASIGAGTLDSSGALVAPLVRLDWAGLELDLYALIEARFVRLFTVSVDLAVPLGLRTDGCSGVTPLVGTLTGAVTNVRVTNSELLAEPRASLEALVPSLLTLAEPGLASGLAAFTVPELQGFSVRVLGAKGVGAVVGTQQFNHLGLYADLDGAGASCTPRGKLQARVRAVRGASVQVEVEPNARVWWRVDGGLWRDLAVADAAGLLTLTHPGLVLGGAHRLELETVDGRRAQLPAK
jgi:hypothetical protein